MSDGWVIDSSVGIAWVHPHQARPETDKLLEEIGQGMTVVAPVLWFMEVANALLVLQRRKKLTPIERRTALQTLSGLNLTVDEAAAQTAFKKTSELAEKHGLSVYDATYLETALRRKLSLASLDGALIAAARQHGLKVI